MNVPDHRGHDLGIGELPGVDALNVAIHRARVDKRVVVYDRDAVIHVPVDISDVSDVIRGVVVVDVCDLHHADACVRNVHALHIARTAVIPRDVNFAGAEREPSYGCCANSDSDAEAGSADEGNQGRGIDWRDCDRTWYPAPAVSGVRPATVVEGGKTPRLVFNPGPSPGRNVGPVAVAIGCPITGDAGRLPDISVFGIIAPAAIVVEILVAGHILRNVFATASLIFALVARLRPAAEIIGRLDAGDVITQLVGA